jgi:hypothetical protein
MHTQLCNVLRERFRACRCSAPIGCAYAIPARGPIGCSYYIQPCCSRGPGRCEIASARPPRSPRPSARTHRAQLRTPICMGSCHAPRMLICTYKPCISECDVVHIEHALRSQRRMHALGSGSTDGAITRRLKSKSKSRTNAEDNKTTI